MSNGGRGWRAAQTRHRAQCDRESTITNRYRRRRRLLRFAGVNVRGLLLRVLFDLVDGVLHRADFLGVFVRDVDLERLFEGEHELDETERVGAEVVDERRLG